MTSIPRREVLPPYRQPRIRLAEAPQRPITEERIIGAMKTLAYIMASRADGNVFSPIWERLERELEDLRERNKPVDRARKFLESFTIQGGPKLASTPDDSGQLRASLSNYSIGGENAAK